MPRLYVSIIAGIIAVLLCATGILASTIEPACVNANTANIATISHAHSDASGIGLALFSILLGSGMVFMIRPRRRVYVYNK